MDINERKEEQGGALGLKFEIGTGDDSFVFDSEAEIEIRPDTADASLGVEISLPDAGATEPEFDFIVDPMMPPPAYMPRFTEASESFNRAPYAMKRSGVAERQEPEVDPTAEIDEEANTPHVIITPATAQQGEFCDESITILKFDAVSEAQETPDPEEELARELENTVYEACAPEINEEPREEPAAVAEPEPVADDDTAMPVLADPSMSAIFIDYTPSEGDAERVSDEEAPDERGSAKRVFGEYVTSAQQDLVKDGFLDKIMSVRVRLVAASLIFLMMLTVDVLKLFGISVFDYLVKNVPAGLPAVADMAFATVIFLFGVPEIIRAGRCLFQKTVMPELIMIPSLLAVAVHSGIVLASGIEEYPTFATLLGIQAVAAILGTNYRISAEFSSFRIISRTDVKNILDKRLTRTLPRENIALDGVVDEYKSKTARMFRASFISDFFLRTSRGVENSFNVILMSAVTLGVSLVTAVIVYFINGYSVTGAASSFTFVFLLAFPAFSILIHKLPYKKATDESYAENSTFVGEGSYYSSSDIDVIAYDDTEIFGEEDVSLKKVHLYGKAYNATRAMSEMYSIFSVVGGPLAHVFSSAVDGKGTPADNIVIEDDGISGSLGENTVYAGTKEYMVRHGVKIPEDDYKTDAPSYDSTKVMYGASEGEVYVKFFVRYSFSEEFTMSLPSLKAEKIIPLIYTRDPNITLDLLKTLTLGEDLIRVMKKHIPRTKEERVYNRVSAGIVTLGDKSNAINMVLLAKRYTAFQATMSLSELIAMISGAIFAVTFAVTGSFGMPVIALGALQIAWCIYLYLRTAYSFHTKKSKGK